MLSDIFNLKKDHSKKSIRYFLSACSLVILIAVSIQPQSPKEEKIKSLIKELTPSHSIKKSYKNIDIIGYDILDRNKNRITSSKFKYYPGNQLHIVIFAKRKIMPGKAPEENKIEKCLATLEHEGGGYFWSQKTTYLSGEQEIEEFRDEWKIGGIYKVRFSFEVPEFALPGNYKFKTIKEKPNRPDQGILIEFNQIKISLKRPKISRIKKTEDYDLALEGCLLNPALNKKDHIAFPWTGNIEFFMDEDMRNFRKIVVNAKGTIARGVFPLLKVYTDNSEIGQVYINNEWSRYEFDLKLEKKTHILKVRFDNNAGGPGEDRNMYVNLIKLLR